MSTESFTQPRRVRSFVRRVGRITAAQEAALQASSAQYVLSLDSKPTAISRLLMRDAPRLLEIGFGDGSVITQFAADHPDWDCIGVDVHTPGLGSALIQCNQHELSNIYFFCADVIDVLSQVVPVDFFDHVMVLFPDPWQKRRHHKRRLISTEFIQFLIQYLKLNSTLHVATDWQNYANHIEKVFRSLTEYFEEIDPAPYLGWRNVTKFERRGKALGHLITDKVYRLISKTK